MATNHTRCPTTPQKTYAMARLVTDPSAQLAQANPWFLLVTQLKHVENRFVQSRSINVWYIYLHLVIFKDFYGKCKQMYHTLILWNCEFL